MYYFAALLIANKSDELHYRPDVTKVDEMLENSDKM